MKKFHIRSIVLALTLLLSACGSSGGEVSLTTFESENFTIGVIENWQIIERSDIRGEKPQGAVVAFLNPDPNINIAIHRELFEQSATSLEYANANISRAQQEILDYEELEIREVEIAGTNTRLHIFKGRSGVGELLQKFVQAYVTDQNIAYTITASAYIDSEEIVIQQLISAIESFTLVETPSEE